MRKISKLEWIFVCLTVLLGCAGIIAVGWYEEGDIAGVLFIMAFISFVFGMIEANWQGGDGYSQESNRRTDVRPKETTERCQDR